MNDTEKLTDLFNSQQFMVIAVVLPDGMPWVVPVRVQKHNDTIFEWDSALDTKHSQALAANPNMAITVFQKLENAQTGFYAKGRGELVEEFKPGFGRYQFTAEQCWLNDETFVKREVQL